MQKIVTGYGIVFAEEVPSRSRPGVKHYTRVVVTPRGVKATCDCEGYAIKGTCWHIQYLLKKVLEYERSGEA